MSVWLTRYPLRLLGGIVSLWALVTVIFFALFSSLKGETPSDPPRLPPSQFDERILALDTEAIDAAYREHVQRMYAVWMKDDAGQPARALNGVRHAQRAYIRSMEAIKRRQDELKGGR